MKINHLATLLLLLRGFLAIRRGAKPAMPPSSFSSNKHSPPKQAVVGEQSFWHDNSLQLWCANEKGWREREREREVRCGWVRGIVEVGNK
jgi:hypothetical protein